MSLKLRVCIAVFALTAAIMAVVLHDALRQPTYEIQPEKFISHYFVVNDELVHEYVKAG